MPLNVIIYDDFYPDPDEVRRIALEAEHVRDEDMTCAGTFAGPYVGPGVDDLLAGLVGCPIKPSEGFYYGTFKCSGEASEFIEWIHHDPVDWVAVVYLNPPGTFPDSFGLSFWEHKETGWREYPGGLDIFNVTDEMRKYGFRNFLDLKCKINFKQGHDPSLWNETLHIPAVYNRAVIFRPIQWHAGTPYDNFGHSLETNRLVQIYSFDEVREEARPEVGSSAAALDFEDRSGKLVEHATKA